MGNKKPASGGYMWHLPRAGAMRPSSRSHRPFRAVIGKLHSHHTTISIWRKTPLCHAWMSSQLDMSAFGRLKPKPSGCDRPLSTVLRHTYPRENLCKGRSMSKTHLIAALSVPSILLFAGLVLGSLSTNYFAAAGLLLSLLSAMITIFVASKNALKARQAAITGIEPYEPISAKRLKLFSRTVPTSDPVRNLQKQLEELRRDHEELADNVDRRVESVFNYAQMAHERLTQHKEAELPQILSAQSGVIIAGAVLSLLGAVVVFAPDHVYGAFSQLVTIGVSLAIQVAC